MLNSFKTRLDAPALTLSWRSKWQTFRGGWKHQHDRFSWKQQWKCSMRCSWHTVSRLQQVTSLNHCGNPAADAGGAGRPWCSHALSSFLHVAKVNGYDEAQVKETYYHPPNQQHMSHRHYILAKHDICEHRKLSVKHTPLLFKDWCESFLNKY